MDDLLMLIGALGGIAFLVLSIYWWVSNGLEYWEDS